MIQPTRRTVVRTAAWATPAVALTAAAPAYAGSGSATISFNPGASTITTTADTIEGFFHDVTFRGASIVLAGSVEDAVSVTLAVSFTPVSGVNTLTPLADLPGFTSPTTDSSELLYVSTTTHGSAHTFTLDGDYFGTAFSNQEGTFNIVVSAPGFTSENATWAIATPGATGASIASRRATTGNPRRR